MMMTVLALIRVRIVDQKLQVKTNQFWAVVDTGSDNCLFYADALKPFKIKLEDGIRGKNIGGIGKQATKQAERGAAVALERAYFGDLFPVVPNLGNGNKNTAVN